MNTRERFAKISALRTVFESTSIDDIKAKVWKTKKNYKFSDKYQVAKVSERIANDVSGLSEITDSNIEKMHDMLIDAVGKRSFFEDKNVAAEFLSKIASNYAVDIRILNNDIINKMDDVCESIRENHNDYNPHDELTWGSNGEIGDMYHQLYGDILIDNKMILDKKIIHLNNIKRTKLMESVTVDEEGKKDIYKMVYDVLDDNSILLLYSYIFGHMVDYNSKVRDKVYDYLLKNPESPAVDMVTGTVGDDEIDSLMRSFNYYDAQSFLLGTSFVAFMNNKDGKLCRVNYITNNKFGIKEIK